MGCAVHGGAVGPRRAWHRFAMREDRRAIPRTPSGSDVLRTRKSNSCGRRFNVASGARSLGRAFDAIPFSWFQTLSHGPAAATYHAVASIICAHSMRAKLRGHTPVANYCCHCCQ